MIIGAALVFLVAATPSLSSEQTFTQAQVDEIVAELGARGITAGSTPAVSGGGESWTDRLSFFGDFRGRYEGFWWDEDPNGAHRRNNHRARYRLRLGGKAEVNDYIDVKFRLATGGLGDRRSRNQTMGGVTEDFDPDAFNVDQAYIALKPLAKMDLSMGQKLDVKFGKVGNMFRSKVGKDYLFWDGDLTPEGVVVGYEVMPTDGFDLAFNGGYLLVDQQSGEKDLDLWAMQLRALAKGDAVSGGANLSWYGFRSVTTNTFEPDGTPRPAGRFITDGLADGNLVGGLTDDSKVDIADLRVWGKLTMIEGWPILVYGNVLRNFSAKDVGAMAGKEDLAWSVGVEVGDKKKVVKVGAGYFRVEANAVPAGNFTDSDLFEHKTNAEGWAIYAARQIFKNTDLSFTLFLMDDPLDKDIPDTDALEDSDRTRLQVNVVVKF
jgi:hypothetical protein